ncbi:hypothetical protein RRG08_062808, partial [Elysia crispata]
HSSRSIISIALDSSTISPAYKQQLLQSCLNNNNFLTVQQMPHANIPPTCNTTVAAVAPLRTKLNTVFKASTTPASAV